MMTTVSNSSRRKAYLQISKLICVRINALLPLNNKISTRIVPPPPHRYLNQ